MKRKGENERTFRYNADLVPPIAEAGDVVLDVTALREFALQQVALVQEQDDLSSFCKKTIKKNRKSARARAFLQPREKKRRTDRPIDRLTNRPKKKKKKHLF